LESYRNTGYNEISVLSLSSSDYPHFEELILRLKEVFRPLGVNISVPSLRVNEQLRSIAELIGNDRRSGLTLAPEVARDDMREQIRKKIKNEDLYEGCRKAFENNFQSVKLYFMCGLPGERPVDLDGIIDEPACTAGRVISASPVRGPDERRRRSLDMRRSSTEHPLSAPDSATKSAIEFIDSCMSSAGLSPLMPDIRERFLTARTL